MINKNFYIITLENTNLESVTSFVVIGIRKPSKEEASEFWKNDIFLLGGSLATIATIEPISYEEAVSAYDLDSVDEWPVFGISKVSLKNKKVAEKVYKRCPKCNYHHFAAIVQIQQKALIGGEGEYIDEYDSEITNPVVSDTVVWQCTRCGYEAKGSEFSVRESKLKDAEKADLFSFHKDIISKDALVLYKGNECIGEVPLGATIADIKEEIAKQGYYLVDSEDIYSNDLKVAELSYTAECELVDGVNSISVTIENIKKADDFDWTKWANSLYNACSDFVKDGTLAFVYNIKTCNGDIIKRETKYFDVSHGVVEF